MNRPTLAARLLAVIESSPLRPLFCELQGAFPDVPPQEMAAALDELFDFGQIGALPQGAENPVGESAGNHAARRAHATAEFEPR